MSPVGGLGINYVIEDSTVAANDLGNALKRSEKPLRNLDVGYLAAVQRRRELPTRVIQRFQALIQQRVLAPALGSDQPFAPPLPLRLLPRVPVLRNLPARLIAFGLWPVRVKSEGKVS